MVPGWIIGAILVGFAGGQRKGGFLRAFTLSMLFTPIVGLFLTLGAAKKNAIGCQHCGNKENEAEYCGMCGKNVIGEMKPGWVERSKK